MGVLKSKTAALETAVGNTAAAGTELLAESATRSAETLKVRVAALEKDAADVVGRVTALEGEVLDGGASLLEDRSDKNDNLEARVAILKATVADLKPRVHTLESATT